MGERAGTGSAKGETAQCRSQLPDVGPQQPAYTSPSDTEMTATVQAKVGPVKATFKGHVTLSNIDPPVAGLDYGHVLFNLICRAHPHQRHINHLV